MSSDKYFNGETPEELVNQFDDINNNLAFEATEVLAKDTSKISEELSDTVSVHISKIASKNLTNRDHKIDDNICILLR